MTPAIITKLSAILTEGISTEAEVVYVLSGVRKILERDKREDEFDFLKFHCDWAFHATLKGKKAQDILSKFDAANISLKGGIELSDLPQDLGAEIEQISKMLLFRSQLLEFLSAYGIAIGCLQTDWIKFLLLYTKVIEDIPLIMWAATDATISKVTIQIIEANPQPKGQFGFAVDWVIEDRSGKSGSIFVMNFMDIDEEE